MQRRYTPHVFTLFILSIAWISIGLSKAEGQDVLRAEHKGLCKSLLPDACATVNNTVNKTAQRSLPPLTRLGAEAVHLRKQRHYERRLLQRYEGRAEALRSRRPARKANTYSGAVNEQDSLALVALYEALDGSNWQDNTGWLEGPVASWNGVVVNEVGRVSELGLRSNDLFGFIPAELTNLTELIFLDLGDNFLLGLIPAQIGNLTNLEVLDLSFNILSNEIPSSLANLSNLFELVLWGNNLTGEIPSFIGNFANLELLSLEFNQFQGTIPSELGQLANLRQLFLDQNLLSGTIPPELGNLNSLLSVFLGRNDLEGSIPVELMSLDGLLVLSIFDAGLSGPLPKELGNLSSLVTLDLGSNNFEGPLPDELQQLFLLSVLYLDNNFLTGELPEDIGFTLPNLTELNLASNFLEGSIPASIQEMGILRFLDLGSNQLSGIIPDMNANQRLRFLYLDQNNFTGDIANQFIAFFALFELNVSGNNLSGEIPAFLANSTFMQRLWLADNAFEGAIPPILTTLEDLVLLDLWNNDLEGPIPSGIVSQTSLETLDLGWNAFSGSLPEGINKLDRLKNVFLDINELSGAIPESFTGADSIRVLTLNDNFLTKIPDLSQMALLDSVSLGNNLLGFDSIEPNLGIADGRISYAPQRPLPLIVDELENTIRFVVDVGGSANQYQWFLGNSPISGATTTTYEAASATLNSSDSIVLEVISRIVPNLILATEPIRADARLIRVIIAPPIQTVAPGDSVQFEYVGLDQFNNTRRFTGTWAAEGGTIDQSGLFIAGEAPGEYEISVNNTLGVSVGSTTISISGAVSNEVPERSIQEYALDANFPNPFMQSTEVRVAVPEASYIQLKIYNVLGQEMETVVERVVQPGLHRFTVNAEQWPAGLYLYTFQADGFRETRKMVKVQ